MSQHSYVETSALLRVLLEGDEALLPLLVAENCYTSALTLAEARRAIRRARSAGRLDAAGAQMARRRVAEFESWAEIIPVNEDVLKGTDEEFPVEPVRTLDAIHLATIQLLADTLPELCVVSTDDRVRGNATALGINVVPIAK
jgi:predicted nucleic acid-binding protein